MSVCGVSFKAGALVVEDDCLIVPTFASTPSLTQFRPVPLSDVISVAVAVAVDDNVLREELPSAVALLLLLSAIRCICRMTVAA